MKLNAEKARWSQRYQTALNRHLQPGTSASLLSAPRLGRRAVDLGMEALDVVRVHEQALATLASPGESTMVRQRMTEQAKRFFAETIVPIDPTHRAAQKADVRVQRLTETLRRRTSESCASARRLERTVRQRKVTEEALKKSWKQNAKLLAEAHRLQKHLRHLTDERLSTQEDERHKMSRVLPPDWSLRLVDTNVRGLTEEDLAWAECAFISAMVVQRESAHRIVARCKEAGLRVVAGGPPFNSEHDQFEAVDHFVLNEAELTLPPFLDDLAQGHPRRIYSSADFADLRQTPIPLWNLLDLKRYASMSIQFSRG